MNKLIYVIGGFILASLILGAFIMWQASSDLTVLLPDTIEDWKISAKDQNFNRENLYKYINGGAELYISYGFKKVINRTYSKREQPDIVVDLFDMGTSHNAFGVFSHSRETIDNTFGQGSEYTQGQLLFWKNHFFVSILASPETVESKKAVFNIARKIETAIKGKGPLPEILTFLPQRSLVRESIRYFHHYIWLNSYFFVADRNILHINETTDVILAKYGGEKKRYILLLVKYKKNKDAKKAYNDFIKYYLPGLSRERAVQIEDGTWTACQLAENLLIIVFNAPIKDKAVHLIETVQKNFFIERTLLNIKEKEK
jgi:hypothetical protein